MYCKNCGTKVGRDDSFCMNCGQKLRQSKTNSKTNAQLVKKITLTSLDLFKAKGDEYKKNFELVPEDCWILFSIFSKGQAESFISKHRLSNDTPFLDKLAKDYLAAHTFGMWIWIAEKKHTDPSIFDGRINFNYEEDVAKDSVKFITEWDALLDHVDKLIPADVEPSLASAEVLMADGLDNDSVLDSHLSAKQLMELKSDLKGAIYRGYLLHEVFE